jgi:hypothetical protein
MLKILSNFINLALLARMITFSIFLLCIVIIWFALQKLNHQPVVIDYKTLNSSTLEKYELYKRNLDDSPYLLISKNNKINFAFSCNSQTTALCDNEVFNSGNKVIIDHVNIVSIKGEKYIQFLQIQDSTAADVINYFVSHDQLAFNYYQSNKSTIFTVFIIFLIPFTSLLILCYVSLERKIVTKLSNLKK